MVDTQPTQTQPSLRSTSTRPSSRRALTAALELAQEAVRLDSTNDDPIGAIRAYSRSVALLNEVMERVMRGEDDSGRGRHFGRPRSMVAREEEVRRLRSIHDTYADRMNILSDIYNIDPTQLLESSTNPLVPAPQLLSADSHQIHNRDIPLGTGEPTGDIISEPSRDRTATPDSTMSSSDHASLMDSSLPGFEMVHPPSMLNNNSNSHSFNSSPSTSSRHSSMSSRISVLPPPLPPPSGPLPGRPRTGSLTTIPLQPSLPKVASFPVSVSRPTSISTSEIFDTRSNLIVPSRPRGNSSAHRRTGSDNKLEALHEEGPDTELTLKVGTQSFSSLNRSYEQSVPYQTLGVEETPTSASSHTISLPPPLPSKDTLPGLPITLAIPPPASVPPMSPATPKGAPFVQSSILNQESSSTTLRSRGSSTPTVRTDSNGQHSLIINSTPSAGTISQRRTKTSTGTISSQTSSRSSTPGTVQSSPTNPSPTSQSIPTVRLPGASLPPLPSVSPGGGRHRSSSQPPRPGAINVTEMGVRPSLPHALSLNTHITIPRKPSFPSRLSSIQTPTLTTPTQLGVPQTANISSYMPSSPIPPPPPTEVMLKPYHLMALLWTTMTSKSGGFVTRRLHVPNEVWSQGGVKLSNLPDKVKVVDVLSSALEELQVAGLAFASSSSNIFLAPSCTPDDAERWLNKLDDWNAVCDSVVTSFGKKLGVGEGFVVKKNGGVPFWKVVRSMTNGKSLDSPAAYVSGLVKLFHLVQILGEHAKALLSPQLPLLYISVPIELRQALELRLKRSSEFFASVVLTFVVRDLSLLLDKYVKKGEKWLAE
ncbi:hypothetical protein Clacol_003625 [Clathrus columnatus]|uniref:MIT domain-containing protein n=1 Tax=Clathrus columnatus TaxID=1419009 RepID=A0AAV5A9S2_9AGAM|nr:hypothetical protein Clacol_003625 [Clathrus columnatus]